MTQRDKPILMENGSFTPPRAPFNPRAGKRAALFVTTRPCRAALSKEANCRKVAFGPWPARRILVWLLHFLLCAGATGAGAEPAATPPSAFSWAGLYFGLNMGAGIPLHRFESLEAAGGFYGPAFDLDPKANERTGINFGAQLGYNWQRGNLVYGVESDLSFLDGERAAAGSFVAPPAYVPLGLFSYTLSRGTGGNYFGSLRGRVGLAVDRTLLYLTGGIASGGWRGPSTLTLGAAGALNPFLSGETASSRTKFILGGAAQYALDANWSARAEYLYLNQSYGTQLFDNGAGFDFASKRWEENHIFRLGLNYRLPAGDTLEPLLEPARRDANEGAGAMEKEKRPQEAEPETYSVHGQATVMPQGYPEFRAKYSGQNSLPPSGEARSTVSITNYLGLRVWDGSEAYFNPEIDEGYGPGNTVGVAGYPTAEAFKTGHARPYLRFQRYFLRQTIGLGGDKEKIEPGQNLLAQEVDANRLTLTIGKYSPVDIFDDNRYAHNARDGFINWSIVEMGAFDYASDAWSYSNVAAAEWKQDWWTLRAGFSQLTNVPGSETIEPELFRQWSPMVELEARHSLFFGQQGKIKLLAYDDIGYMGKFDEAMQIAAITGTTPSVALDRKRRSKAGGGINVEQPISDDLGFFLRASMDNGRYETFDYTSIDRSLSGGFVLQGEKWARPKDAIGVAGVLNGISNSRIRYLAAGGNSLLVGDGALSYDGERILETYYKYNLTEGVHVTGDYQFVQNPAYNTARGPVSIFAIRLHGEF